MKKSIKVILSMIVIAFILSAVALPAFAAEEPAADAAAVTAEAAAEKQAADPEAALKQTKAIAAGAVIAIVATAGAIAMALSITKSADGIARQPEAAGNIRTSLMLGLVFIETAIIYALIVAILIVFVL